MRVSALIIASAHANVNHSHRRVARQADDDRRYFQLVDMMENYNPQFDERKYWAYGCNCLILGEFEFKNDSIELLNDLFESKWTISVQLANISF